MTQFAEGLTVGVNRLFEWGTAWLDRPLPRWQLALGWLLATLVFVGLTHTSGGPSYGDGPETFFPAWAIAHGHLACAFPKETPSSSVIVPFAAPLYPLLTAGLAAVFRIGHDVAFPSAAQLGPHCEHAIAAITAWSNKISAKPMTMFGYLGWLALMAGIVSLLRTTTRALTGWEPVTLILVAASPSVLQCVQTFAHPQDMLAMGLILGSLANVLRERWTWVGVLLGLAFTSQQFAVLVIVPLFIVISSTPRARFVAGLAAGIGVVSAPLVWFDPSGALRAVFLGSNRLAVIGREPAQFTGGTVLAHLHLHGLTLFVVARVLPVLASAAVAWWAARRLGPRVLQPVALFSLVTISLCTRLLFEENIFEYYFMAVTVMLLLLSALRRRWHGYTLTWIIAVALAFSFLRVSYFSADLVMFIVVASLFAVFTVLETVRRGLRWTFVGFIVLLVVNAAPTIWGRPSWDHLIPTSAWQIILTSSALVLAVEPLLGAIRADHDSRSAHELPPAVQ